jgi:uncharacterized protein YcsI (UPF0317 family)
MQMSQMIEGGITRAYRQACSEPIAGISTKFTRTNILVIPASYKFSSITDLLQWRYFCKLGSYL